MKEVHKVTKKLAKEDKQTYYKGDTYMCRNWILLMFNYISYVSWSVEELHSTFQVVLENTKQIIKLISCQNYYINILYACSG